MKAIKDAEEQVQIKIGPLLKQLDLLPEGYQCSVRFQNKSIHGKSRKKKQTALLEKNWHPDTDSIKIKFERAPASLQARRREADPGRRQTNAIPAVSASLDELIRAC